MRYWIDEKSGTHMCEPDCCDEWLEYMWATAVDYDGCKTVESLKGLVDELVEMSQKARECLHDGRLWADCTASRAPGPIKVLAEVNLHEAGATADIYNDTALVAMEMLKDRIWEQLIQHNAVRFLRHRDQIAATETFRATLFVTPTSEEATE